MKDPDNEGPSGFKRTELEQHARGIGQVLAECMPPGVGFALMIFDIGEKGNLAYISNAARDDMVRALEEFVGKVNAEANAAARGRPS